MNVKHNFSKQTFVSRLNILIENKNINLQTICLQIINIKNKIWR